MSSPIIIGTRTDEYDLPSEQPWIQIWKLLQRFAFRKIFDPVVRVAAIKDEEQIVLQSTAQGCPFFKELIKSDALVPDVPSGFLITMTNVDVVNYNVRILRKTE